MNEVVRYETPPCIGCGKPSVFTFVGENIERYKRWRFGGVYIQEAFPDRDAATREHMMTGTHPACWAEMFGEEEE